jgi:hypothetical protein
MIVILISCMYSTTTALRKSIAPQPTYSRLRAG